METAYLLDTNVLSELLRPEPDPELARRIHELGTQVTTAAVVWHELTFGVARLPRGKRRRAIEDFLRELEPAMGIVPYDAAAAQWHARERARLIRAGRTPPFVDGQIAATAAIHGLTLVTRNVRDFAGFRGVLVESWFS